MLNGYLTALKVVLQKLELHYQEEKEFWVSFQGEKIGKFRADLVVEDEVIVELKAFEGRMPKIFESQVISYSKSFWFECGITC